MASPQSQRRAALYAFNRKDSDAQWASTHARKAQELAEEPDKRSWRNLFKREPETAEEGEEAKRRGRLAKAHGREAKEYAAKARAKALRGY